MSTFESSRSSGEAFANSLAEGTLESANNTVILGDGTPTADDEAKGDRGPAERIEPSMLKARLSPHFPSSRIAAV